MKFISKFKRKKEINKLKDFADQIIEIFEEKLDELNITLLDKNRENLDKESRIYGLNYYDLEDQIIDFLSMNKKVLQKI